MSFSLHIALLDASPSICSLEYWNGVIQNAIGCTLGSLAAIVAAYLIYLYTNKNARRDKAQEAKDLLIYFKGTVETVIRIAKQQTQNIQTYCEGIKKNDIDLPLLRFIPMYNLKKIAEGDSMDRILIAYIQAFPGKDDAKDFSSLLAEVEYLHGQFLQLPEEMRLTLSYDHERKTEYQKIYKNAHTLLGEYMLKLDPMHPTKVGIEMQAAMQTFFDNHTDNYDISYYHEYFFLPMNKILVDALGTPEISPAIIQLSQITLDGKQQFLYIKAQNQVSRSNMEEIMPNLASAIENLEKHAAKLLAFS